MLTSFVNQVLAPENLPILFIVLFIARFAIFSLLEHYFTAHTFERYAVLFSDLVTMFMYIVLIFPIAQLLSSLIGVEGTFLAAFSSLPLFLRIILYFIVGDFIHYWAHRLMHQPFLWRIHMWHHSPKHVSWTGGFRATVLDSTLLNFGFIFAWPILGDVSYNCKVLLLVFALLNNDWMHLNVNFRVRFLEKLFVMPRYHHIHHSSNKEHYMKNIAALFPIWDKLFGTYVDPDTIQEKLTFGINEKVSTTRLVTGI